MDSQSAVNPEPAPPGDPASPTAQNSADPLTRVSRPLRFNIIHANRALRQQCPQLSLFMRRELMLNFSSDGCRGARRPEQTYLHPKRPTVDLTPLSQRHSS